jgi:hypothetical protein
MASSLFRKEPFLLFFQEGIWQGYRLGIGFDRRERSGTGEGALLHCCELEHVLNEGGLFMRILFCHQYYAPGLAWDAMKGLCCKNKTDLLK